MPGPQLCLYYLPFHSVGAAYMPPAPPLPKAMPAGLYFTSFTNPSPLANARAFSIVVMAMLCNAVRVKNA